MKQEHVIDGTFKFAEDELIPKLDGMQKWVAQLALIMEYPRVQSIIQTITASSVFAALGVIDESGDVNVDAIIKAAKENVDKNGKMPIDIPIIGDFTLDKNDFDQLHKYIKAAAGQ